jgi:hypothetical protein
MTNFGFGVDSGTAFVLAEKTTGHQQTINRQAGRAAILTWGIE